MIISINWLKKYTDIDLPIDQLVKLIGERLVEVEEVIDLGVRYDGIVLARAKKVYKHPGADKLSVVELDDGGEIADVIRLNNGLVQVVCGAVNVREGLMVAWIPPGVVVPATYEDDEPFKLEARELRGVMSNGMIASGKELAINDDHSGIAEIEGDFAVGSQLAAALELDDYLLDIENKSLTHRPDCFGLIGFAREVAAIQGKRFETPNWVEALQPVLAEPDTSKGLKAITVEIEDAQICSRYEAAVIADVDVAMQSPLIIQSYLQRLGIRPINTVVDATNYLMLVTGHPTHAFDYEKVCQVAGSLEPTIRVRGGREGDSLTLLDGRFITPAAEDILICAGETPIGLAGAMGGANTEIGDTTKHLIIESATFNLYNLRGTSMRHGVFTEAVTRFTKGQSAAQTAPVLASAVRMMCDAAKGSLAASITDVYPLPEEAVAIEVSVPLINQLLGTAYSAEDMIRTLTNVNCVVTQRGDVLEVLVPYWRQDLHMPEDIAEEIGRLNGFDGIEPVLPRRPYEAVLSSEEFMFQSRIRNLLVRMGANEVLTYSFVPERLLKIADQPFEQAFRIVNALSPNLQYYRLSLMPSLLEKAYQNSKAGFQDFMLFEINKTHAKRLVGDDGLPLERRILGTVFCSTKRKEEQHGAPFYAAKSYLDNVVRQLGVKVTYEPLSSEEGEPLARPYANGRSAYIMVNDERVGVVGEINQQTGRRMKVPAYTAGFEVDIESLRRAAEKAKIYVPLGRFQGTTYDICFRMDQSVRYVSLLASVTAALSDSPLQWTIFPLDRYQRDGDTAVQTTFHIELVNPEATITGDMINDTMAMVKQRAHQDTGAEVV